MCSGGWPQLCGFRPCEQGGCQRCTPPVVTRSSRSGVCGRERQEGCARVLLTCVRERRGPRARTRGPSPSLAAPLESTTAYRDNKSMVNVALHTAQWHCDRAGKRSGKRRSRRLRPALVNFVCAAVTPHLVAQGLFRRCPIHSRARKRVKRAAGGSASVGGTSAET